MTATKRVLAVLAAGALLAPVVSAGSTASAVAPEPPDPRSVENFCQDVEDNFEPFTDIDGNFFKDIIECLAAARVTEGGPNRRPSNEYGPRLPVRRDGMATFITRLLDTADELDTGDSIRDLPAFDGEVDFTDVPADNVHRERIDRLAEAGIVNGGVGGRSSSMYSPQLEVTRAQMATFIIRAVEFATGDELDTTQDFFTDDEGEDVRVHEPNINAAAAAGIAVGDGRDTFRPRLAIPRDQMSGFLTRALAFMEDRGDIRPLGDEPADFDEIVVTPDDDQALPSRPNPDSTDSDNRRYTATGLATGVEYRISLVREENVGTDNRTFRASADAASLTGFSADTGAPTADITEANGRATTDTDSGAGVASGTATFTATGSSATFVVDSDGPNESVVPVVYRNGAAGRDADEGGTSPRLELENGPAGTFAEPIEAFDVGGAARFGAAATPVTVRPELITTTIVRTFTAAGPTPSAEDDRELTEVRFTFDEEVTGKAPTANRFHLVGFDASTRFDGRSASVEQSRNSVLVTFGAAVSGTNPQGQDVGAEELRDTSVATIDFDAVRDVGGAENLIGDDTIGATRTDVLGAAGITDAPDLLNVSGFASVATATTTQVTFTFDEPAFTLDTTGFHLVTVNNQDITCRAVSGQPGGNPGSGQEADTTILTECSEAVTGGDIAATGVARGYVEAGVVSDEAQDDVPLADGNLNPLQATQTPDANSSGPDLVSATFIDGATSSDRVIFTFDEPVFVLNDTDTDAVPGDPTDTDTDGGTGELDFSVYMIEGSDTEQATAVTRSAENSTQIIADFDEGTIDDAVGASVLQGAVTSATGIAGRANQEDEVGVANTRQETFTAGVTTGPDLRGVAVRSDGTAVYTFDEEVANATTASRFFLDLADGTRLVCTAATVAEGARTMVTCTGFNVVVQNGGAATAGQVQSAVLGSVDEGAVRDTDTEANLNPESAEVTTGTTGTPRQ